MSSLRGKLWLGFGGLLAILVIVSVLSIVVLTRYSRTLEQVFHENYNSVVYCDGMKGALDELNTRAQRLVWEEADADRIDASAQRLRFEENLRSELGNCSLPGETELAERLSGLWAQYRDRLGKLDAAGSDRRALYRGDLLPRYEELKRVAQQIADMNQSNMVSVDGRVKRTLIAVRDALSILVIAGSVLAAVLVGVVAAGILRPLGNLTRSARQIGSGDLDQTVAVTTRDEVGQLAEAFNLMAAKLREFRRSDHDKLVRTQQTTQLAIDSLPDAVCVIGPDGAIDISNRTARTHFAMFPGATVANLRLEWLSRLHARVLAEGKPLEPQGYKGAVQLFEGGEERFLLPRAVPMLDAAGRTIGVTVILVDVTRLRQVDETKSGLVSTVSHELRTPLTSVRMTVNLLADEKFGPLTDKQRQLVDAAREDSERLYRIIDNLLNIGRIEAGKARFQFRLMRPEDIVAQAIDPLRGSFAEKGLRLRITTDPAAPPVMADPTCVSLALTNLLTNALKYTPSGGAVEVSAAGAGASVSFTVTDSGPGIPEKYVPRLFERFFRIPRENGPGGAGLGLAIAKEIVEAHGGQIEYRPAAASTTGSSFSFTLPAASARDAPSALASAATVAEPSQPR